MDNILRAVFESSHGKAIYEKASLAIKEHSMDEALQRGVLVGLSGGADSVMLLCFLLQYRKNNYDFPIVAAHVNHMIRGAAADADEAFSKSLSEKLGIEIIVVHRNIPEISRNIGIGLEEAARNERYCIFKDIVQGRNDIATIAVAHNATDNLETIIFNMMRGAGSTGMSGIQPSRDNIIRPLIFCSGRDIRNALNISSVNYVVDDTNSDTEYTRNYIRHEIIPKLERLSPSPEDAARRVSSNLRSDNDFISQEASKIKPFKSNLYDKELLSGLHKAVLGRVVRNMTSEFTTSVPEAIHIERIGSLIEGDNFSLSLPGGVSFVCQRGVCFIVKDCTIADEFNEKVSIGVNSFEKYSAKLFLSYDKPSETSLNVYNFSIHTSIPCDIIKGELSIRSKKDGDTYRSRGVTHKVKRMFCDAKIPPIKRGNIPLLCDDSGILWIPGFKPRDFDKNSEGRMLYITLAITDIDSDTRFCFANEWDKVRKA